MELKFISIKLGQLHLVIGQYFVNLLHSMHKGIYASKSRGQNEARKSK